MVGIGDLSVNFDEGDGQPKIARVAPVFDLIRARHGAMPRPRFEALVSGSKCQLRFLRQAWVPVFSLSSTSWKPMKTVTLSIHGRRMRASWRMLRRSSRASLNISCLFMEGSSKLSWGTLGKLLRTRLPHSVLKFNARLSADPAMWKKWYLKVSSRMRH